MPTTFPTVQDAPRTVTASTNWDQPLYQSLDDQIQGLGLGIVQYKNQPFGSVYPRLDPGVTAVPPGYAVAIRATQGPGPEPLMVLATAANLAAGAVLLGVTAETIAPGQRGRVAVDGVIPSSVSGLVPAGNKLVRANSGTAVLETVVTPGPTDVLMGLTQTDGALILSPDVYGAADFAFPRGYASLTTMTNADYTLSAFEANQGMLNVPASVTLTANRVLIAPLVQGLQLFVINLSTGGFSLSVKGSSGTASPLIASGLGRLAGCNGVNYY